METVYKNVISANVVLAFLRAHNENTKIYSYLNRGSSWNPDDVIRRRSSLATEQSIQGGSRESSGHGDEFLNDYS